MTTREGPARRRRPRPRDEPAQTFIPVSVVFLTLMALCIIAAAILAASRP